MNIVEAELGEATCQTLEIVVIVIDDQDAFFSRHQSLGRLVLNTALLGQYYTDDNMDNRPTHHHPPLRAFV